MGIIHTTGPKLAKLAGKYGPLVPAVRELILRPDTPLENNVKDMIAAQLDARPGAARRDRARSHRRQQSKSPICRPARLRLAAIRTPATAGGTWLRPDGQTRTAIRRRRSDTRRRLRRQVRDDNPQYQALVSYALRNTSPAPLIADGKSRDTRSMHDWICGGSTVSASASRCWARS